MDKITEWDGIISDYSNNLVLQDPYTIKSGLKVAPHSNLIKQMRTKNQIVGCLIS